MRASQDLDKPVQKQSTSKGHTQEQGLGGHWEWQATGGL